MATMNARTKLSIQCGDRGTKRRDVRTHHGGEIARTKMLYATVGPLARDHVVGQQAPQKKLATARLNRSMSTRNESWPWIEGSRREVDVGHRCPQPFGQFALLRQREQEIRLHADDQRAFGLHPREAGLQAASMVADIEQVHRPRKVQVAVTEGLESRTLTK